MKTLLPVTVIILVLLFSPPKLTPAYGATTYVIENKSNLPLKHRNDFKLLKKMAKFEHLTKRLNESTDKFEIVWLTAWFSVY